MDVTCLSLTSATSQAPRGDIYGGGNGLSMERDTSCSSRNGHGASSSRSRRKFPSKSRGKRSGTTRKYACPVAKANNMLERKHSCTGLSAKNMFTVRNHLTQATSGQQPHVLFLEECPVCKQYLLDKQEFERDHGENCRRDHVVRNGEVQWRALFAKLNPSLEPIPSPYNEGPHLDTETTSQGAQKGRLITNTPTGSDTLNHTETAEPPLYGIEVGPTPAPDSPVNAPGPVGGKYASPLIQNNMGRAAFTQHNPASGSYSPGISHTQLGNPLKRSAPASDLDDIYKRNRILEELLVSERMKRLPEGQRDDARSKIEADISRRLQSNGGEPIMDSASRSMPPLQAGIGLLSLHTEESISNFDFTARGPGFTDIYTHNISIQDGSATDTQYGKISLPDVREDNTHIVPPKPHPVSKDTPKQATETERNVYEIYEEREKTCNPTASSAASIWQQGVTREFTGCGQNLKGEYRMANLERQREVKHGKANGSGMNHACAEEWYEATVKRQDSLLAPLKHRGKHHSPSYDENISMDLDEAGNPDYINSGQQPARLSKLASNSPFPVFDEAPWSITNQRSSNVGHLIKSFDDRPGLRGSSMNRTSERCVSVGGAGRNEKSDEPMAILEELMSESSLESRLTPGMESVQGGESMADTLGSNYPRFSEDVGLERTDSWHLVSDLSEPPMRNGSSAPSSPKPSSINPDPQSSYAFPRALICDDCGTHFKGEYQKGNLARHIRLKHSHSHGSARTYPCENEGCRRTFKRQDSRLKHYRKHHPRLAPGPALLRKSCPIRTTE